MKRLFKHKYPKLTSLILISILTYLVFSRESVAGFFSNLGNLGLIASFIAGTMFTFGFTTPISIGIFVTLNPENIFLSGIFGGFGALFGDLFIFYLTRFSLKNEFLKLSKEKYIKKTENLVYNSLGKKIARYLTYVFAGIVIASPLPDELGVTVLAGLTKINPKIFALISFVLNTAGIFIILLL